MSSMLFSSLTTMNQTSAITSTTMSSNFFDVWTPLDSSKEFEYDLRSSVNLTPTPPPTSDDFFGLPPYNSGPTSIGCSTTWSGRTASGSTESGFTPPHSYTDYGFMSPPPVSSAGPPGFQPSDNVGIVQLVCHAQLTTEQIMEILNSASTDDLVYFFSSMKACRFLNETIAVHESFRFELAALLLRSDVEVIYKLSMNPVGNFMMQAVIGIDGALDRYICTAFVGRLQSLVMDKYGCRVVQTLLLRLPLELVYQLVDGMRGFVMEAAVNRHSVHVIHCICQNHSSWLLEKVLSEVCEPRRLAFLAEDKFGCRLIQHCLESMSEEITQAYVPQLLDRMVVLLLQNLKRFATNKYANYIVQFFLTHEAFQRQRDYIIDQIVIGNILDLAQCQYGSHIVESALQSASPPYLRRIFKEIFDDYTTDRFNRTPLEILLFNQYGNYVIQRLLNVAIDVRNGRRQGDKNWLVYIAHAVYRNKSSIDRYASGKKIILALRSLHPDLFPC